MVVHDFKVGDYVIASRGFYHTSRIGTVARVLSVTKHPDPDKVCIRVEFEDGMKYFPYAWRFDPVEGPW